MTLFDHFLTEKDWRETLRLLPILQAALMKAQLEVEEEAVAREAGVAAHARRTLFQLGSNLLHRKKSLHPRRTWRWRCAPKGRVSPSFLQLS